MLDDFRAAMLTVSPMAKPTSTQETFIGAVCSGLVKVLLSTTVTTLIPAPVTIGLNGIGLILVPNLMSQAALTQMQLLIQGQGGMALKPALDAIMLSISTYFAAAVEVKSISGFGGQALPPTNVTAPLLQAAILAAFPASDQANMVKSKHGLDFIKSISVGIAAGMALGVPGIVPFGSSPPPPGLLVGKFL